MGLEEELERIAAAASAHGDVTGVLAAEPAAGRRRYLVSFGAEAGAGWLVVDAAGRPLAMRSDVRDTASIVAMCELAGELAGGGALEELRNELARVRMTERPPGIEEAEQAALALERTIGAAPRLATPAYLDDVGAATVALERALGDTASPFSSVIASATGVVEEFVRDVERRYLLGLDD